MENSRSVKSRKLGSELTCEFDSCTPDHLPVAGEEDE